MDEAILKAKRAVELGPLSSWHLGSLAWALNWADQFDEAIEILQETLEFDPNNPLVLLCLAMAYVGKGMIARQFQ